MGENWEPEISTIWNEAKAYIDQGNYDKAIQIYKYILIRYEDNPIATEHANAFLGDIYLTLRHLDLAEDYTKKAIHNNPKESWYHYTLGFIYSIQSKWEQAIDEFKQAIYGNYDNAEYLRGLGWAYLNGGEKLQGLEHLLDANRIEPSNVSILLDLANVYLMVLDFEKAKLYSDRALLIDPGNSLAEATGNKIRETYEIYKRGKDNPLC